MVMQLTEKDHFIMSSLSYIDLNSTQQMAAKLGNLTIGQLVKPLNLESYSKAFDKPADFDGFKNIVKEVSNPDSKYYSWKISNYENDPQTGHTAYTFVPYKFEHLPPNNSWGIGISLNPIDWVKPIYDQAIVTFRGSEKMSDLTHLATDWVNNASNTVQSSLGGLQKNAVDYINNIGSQFSSINITGHSLGGNQALAATVGAFENIRDKITNTFTFNAPGFTEPFIKKFQDVINEIKPKITEFQNHNDIFSSMLNNLTKPTILEPLGSIFKWGESLIRNVPQEKGFISDLVNKITNGLDILPKGSQSGWIDSALGMLNGRMDVGGLLKSGLDLLSSGKSSFKLPDISGGILSTGILSEVTKFLPKIGEEASNWANKLFNGVTDMFKGPLDGLFKMPGIDKNILGGLATAIGGGIGGAIGQIGGFINSIIGGSSSHGGNATPISYVPLDVDIYRLRNIAVQLQGIQNRVSGVDSRLHGLYQFNVGDLFNPVALVSDIVQDVKVFLADMNIGDDLRSCILYLNRTADLLDNCERAILQQAHSFGGGKTGGSGGAL